MFHKPTVAAKHTEGVPLLVGLHAWSELHTDDRLNLLGQWSAKHRWSLIVPYTRGPNDNPMAVGSTFAVQDVIDAVAFAGEHVRIDTSRIYLVGGSGGAYLALLMAGVAPTLWAGISVWAPIFDLVKWFHFCTKGTRSSRAHTRFAADISRAVNGPPYASSAQERNAYSRSPAAHLYRARGVVPIDINVGIMDGHGVSPVPISHGLEAFNAVASHADRIPKPLVDEFVSRARVPEALNQSFRAEAGACRTRPLRSGIPRDGDFFKVLFCRRSGLARLTVFAGQHQTLWRSALDWLSLQKRNASQSEMQMAAAGGALQKFAAGWRPVWRAHALALSSNPWPGETGYTSPECSWCQTPASTKGVARAGSILDD